MRAPTGSFDPETSACIRPRRFAWGTSFISRTLTRYARRFHLSSVATVTLCLFLSLFVLFLQYKCIELLPQIPCDLVLLTTSDPNGLAYIETGTHSRRYLDCARVSFSPLPHRWDSSSFFPLFSLCMFISAANLDGESDYKTRVALPATLSFTPLQVQI